mmetsp:Transcript_28356/g.40621  ORF Transcript_28356/g.40621 Transcript_28356/m.40621 type:complete len:119 (+) Transcript_28356:1701-2057(+)
MSTSTKCKTCDTTSLFSRQNMLRISKISVSNNLINTFQLQLKSEIFTQEARLTEFASKITSSFKQALESSVETSKSHFTALKDSMMEHAQSLQMTLTIPRPMKLHQLFNRYLSKPLKN